MTKLLTQQLTAGVDRNGNTRRLWIVYDLVDGAPVAKVDTSNSPLRKMPLLRLSDIKTTPREIQHWRRADEIPLFGDFDGVLTALAMGKIGQ